MKATNILEPDYFHRVVDCQWACPAHTPVPEYIRRISIGDHVGAYMINWRSNVFPGILGRTCDRPCEPACRRGRVEEEPVAICRLKRVAADNKGDVSALMPKPPEHRNGKRIACVGAGPASLTVARDLAPLGYEVVVFDADRLAGGMMRSQIPKFRLPDEVIDEEVGYVLGGGAQFVAERRIESLSALLNEGFDAVFVGSGAPRGRDLSLPGREAAAANIHIGIDWLASVSFGHTNAIGRRVIVLGGGNTAMDCCRSSLRLGGVDIKVIVRSGFAEMKASPWEKEDALREGVEIINYHVPKAFLHEAGKLTGMTFEKVAASKDANGRRVLTPTGEPEVIVPCDDVLIAVGQENAFPWIDPGSGVEFGRDGLPKARRRHIPIEPSLGLLRRRRGLWAEEHHHRRRARPRGRDFDRRLCRGANASERPPPTTNLISQKMGIHEWSYDNAIVVDRRFKSPHRRQCDRAEEHRDGSRTRLRSRAGDCGGEALPQLRRRDCLLAADLHRMRRLRRHLPGRLHLLRRRRPRGSGARLAERAGGQYFAADLCLAAGQDRTHPGQGRGPLPALRPLRRALPDRGVGHAEIHDRARTSGERMSIQAVNDFVIRFANVNGSGSASANLMFARSILRMGAPIAPRNIFPSNIQGLPTWYEIRVTQDGYLGARGGTDLMIAMNPQTFERDVASIEPGGYLFYDNSRPIPAPRCARTSSRSACR